MASWGTEQLSGKEEVTGGTTHLTGYSFTSTGTLDALVKFHAGDRYRFPILVPAGENVSISGLNEPFENGLTVESAGGDGKLAATVWYKGEEVELPDEEPDLEGPAELLI